MLYSGFSILPRTCSVSGFVVVTMTHGSTKRGSVLWPISGTETLAAITFHDSQSPLSDRGAYAFSGWCCRGVDWSLRGSVLESRLAGVSFAGWIRNSVDRFDRNFTWPCGSCVQSDYTDAVRDLLLLDTNMRTERPIQFARGRLVRLSGLRK